MRSWRFTMMAALFSAWLGLATLAVAQDVAQDPIVENPAAQDQAPPANDPPSPPGPQVTQCPAPSFRAQLLTSVAGRIPRDAALVVGLFPGGSHRELPTLQLERRRSSIAMTREAIAPGLFRVRPDTNRLYGAYNLSGVEGQPSLLFARATIPGPPAQPRLERVERYVVVSRGGPRTELRAHYGFPIPQGIVAILSFWGEDDRPDLFARAVPTTPTTVLWAASGSCSDLPDGATEPPESGSVRVAFVDQFGQVSRPSAPRSYGR